CSGNLFDPGSTEGRAIVLVDATVTPPREIRRFPEAASLGAPFGPSLAFASDKLLIGVAYGDAMGGRNDVAFSLDVESGSVGRIVDAGAPFALGDVLCSPGCTDLCLLADAKTKAVRVYRFTGDGFSAEPSFAVDPSIGLPPRGLGAL